MRIELPEAVQNIIGTLASHGYEAYAVGGCVRDSLLGRTPQDWDITTSAQPAQVKELFSHTIDTGIAHGTVTVMHRHTGYEVTTYRIDGEYEDARHPKEVTFTRSLSEDLKRRDFTINAMAYNEKDGLVDVFDGESDLAKGLIRCVGAAEDRFSEDALRMLRAVRFAAQLGFSIGEETKAAIRKLSPTIARVSAERITAELLKLLCSPHPGELRTAYELGLTAVFLPELDEMMRTEQNTPHHSYTVGEHTLRALEAVPPQKELRLAILLHDAAKPACRTTDANGRDHFHGHPQRGAQMARAILRRMKLDNATTVRVCRLVEFHDDRPPVNERGVRRAIARAGADLYPALFDVKRADILAQSAYRREQKLAELDGYERLYQRIMEEGQCVSKKELAVDGRDLIGMGLEPGPKLGRILEELYRHVIEEPQDNTKEALLALARAKTGIG